MVPSRTEPLVPWPWLRGRPLGAKSRGPTPWYRIKATVSGPWPRHRGLDTRASALRPQSRDLATASRLWHRGLGVEAAVLRPQDWTSRQVASRPSAEESRPQHQASAPRPWSRVRGRGIEPAAFRPRSQCSGFEAAASGLGATALFVGMILRGRVLGAEALVSGPRCRCQGLDTRSSLIPRGSHKHFGASWARTNLGRE